MNRNDYSYSPNHLMQHQQHQQRGMYMDTKSHPSDYSHMMAHHQQGPGQHHAPPHHGQQHHVPAHHPPHHQGPPAHGHHPQQHMGHHNGGEFDHEPLVLNNGHPQHGFYQQMNAPMLHVSADFSNVNSMGSMHNDHDDMDDNKTISGQKRSREELNQKEKKRMFKLNETIHQLKKLLDDAGVSCKKNKQSILDNTVHYISMLRNDLVIAKQKADHAERMLHSSGGSASKVDAPFDRYFENSSTPTLIITLDLQVVRANRAFREATGYSEDALKNKDVLLGCLSADIGRARSLVHNAVDSRKTVRTVVQNAIANGRSTSSLSLTLLLDPQGNPESLECVLIPMEEEQTQYDMLKEDVTLEEVSGLV
ncbi:DNA binding protein [Thraustotheca clavata]|uniref:DNA binding protein n=1 Tax=Thraustotheca clavata TaxID=74557 RepID=A0A1V9YYA8_9STRA|nr:DNA binding protein [Thraustotheca clavata]